MQSIPRKALPHSTPMVNDLAIAAMKYAAGGWPVFPVAPKGKIPLTEHGLNDASADGSVVREWWIDRPDANIGYPTGRHIVLDVDGPDGEVALKELERVCGSLPQTLEAWTGRGRHLFFTPNSKPVKNSTGKLGPHLDVRSTGGYVVLPPSIHESGKKYQWGNHFKPEPLPEWLAALLADSPRQQALPDAGEKIPQGQ